MVNFLSKAQITCVNWLQENFNNQFLWLLNKSNIDKCLLHWRIMSNFAAIFRITIIMRKHLSAILYIAILLVISFLVLHTRHAARRLTDEWRQSSQDGGRCWVRRSRELPITRVCVLVRNCPTDVRSSSYVPTVRTDTWVYCTTGSAQLCCNFWFLHNRNIRVIRWKHYCCTFRKRNTTTYWQPVRPILWLGQG